MNKNKLWSLLFAMIPGMLMAQGGGKFAEYKVANLYDTAPLKAHTLQYNQVSHPESDENTMYLINLGAFKDGDYHYFLNKAGHWGVEGALEEVGFPFYINYTGVYSGRDKYVVVEFLSSPKLGSNLQNHISWVYDGVQTTDDRGMMFDRRDQDVELSSYRVKSYSKWRVYVNKGNLNEDGIGIFNYISPDGSPGQYLTINKSGKRRYYVTKLTNDKNDPYAKWAFVSRAELIEHFKKNSQTYRDFFDATFMLDDPSFSRKDANAGKWHKEKTNPNGEINFNNAAYIEGGESPNYQVKEKDKEYTTTRVGDHTYYNTLYGSFFNAEMKNTAGSVYSTTNTGAPETGWYLLTAQGFYRPGDGSKNQNAFMFTEVMKKDGTLSMSKIQTRTIKLPLYEDNLTPADLTQTGIYFAENRDHYTVKLMIYLEEGQKVKFGVKLPEDKSTKNRKEWVVFDNFQLKYMGIDFLVSQEAPSQSFYKFLSPKTYKPMVLERQFQKDKWNTLLLPVSLNKEQIQIAFGPEVRVAKLKGLNGARIEFETIDLKPMGLEDEVIIKKVPYLIYVTDLGLQNEKTTDWPVCYRRDEKTDYSTTKPFYVIPQVSFDMADAVKDDIVYGDLTIKGVPFKLEQLKVLDYTYVMNKGTLIHLTKGKKVKMAGLRWYLEYTNGIAARSARFSIDDEDQYMDTTSGIESMETASEKTPSAIYTINGMKLNAKDTKALPRGIYVVDGKKVAVY